MLLDRGFDRRWMRLFAGLPKQEGVAVTVRHVTFDGAIDFVERFVDGRLADVVRGSSHADVLVRYDSPGTLQRAFAPDPGPDVIPEIALSRGRDVPLLGPMSPLCDAELFRLSG